MLEGKGAVSPEKAALGTGSPKGNQTPVSAVRGRGNALYNQAISHISPNQAPLIVLRCYPELPDIQAKRGKAGERRKMR